jgi:hypothetical protein
MTADGLRGMLLDIHDAVAALVSAIVTEDKRADVAQARAALMRLRDRLKN